MPPAASSGSRSGTTRSRPRARPRADSGAPMALTLDAKVDEKLRALVERREGLARRLADPAVVGDVAAYREASKQFAELGPVVETYETFVKASRDYQGAKELMLAADDAEMKGMAADEVRDLEARLGALEAELKVLLLPSDPNDAKNVVLEIRAGTGGDEATLFAAEIFRM